MSAAPGSGLPEGRLEAWETRWYNGGSFTGDEIRQMLDEIEWGYKQAEFGTTIATEADRLRADQERLREAGNALAHKAEALMAYTVEVEKRYGGQVAVRGYLSFPSGAKEVGNEYREALSAWRSLVAGTDSGASGSPEREADQ